MKKVVLISKKQNIENLENPQLLSSTGYGYGDKDKQGTYWQLEYDVAHYGKPYKDVVEEAVSNEVDIKEYIEFIKSVYTMPGTVGFSDGFYSTKTYYNNDTI